MCRVVFLQEAPSCYPAEIYATYIAPQIVGGCSGADETVHVVRRCVDRSSRSIFCVEQNVSIVGVIPQSMQLHAHITLVSLG